MPIHNQQPTTALHKGTNIMNLASTRFEKCIKCTICTVYCPVAKANPNYPGPKESGPDGERLRLKSPEYYDEALKLCTNCKRCETACPSNVNVGDIIAVARGKFEKKKINPKLNPKKLKYPDLTYKP
ncbi:4Fe-4S dicluster domain-containing protein [Moritella sp.]|uniref:4Fe-4S dicluster domain-containing protein n=1 Tax=Moritella sp. TaxID=78556 RepID=UPI0025F8E79B|nr:4Fe-4S dicluster domain-containing protein [Moritella sp.]